jgi:hypothetical protein
MDAINPAELAANIPAPRAPRRLTEGCPELNQLRALSFSQRNSGTKRPSRNPAALVADEIEVYRAVLEERRSQGWFSLNVSARTYSLDADFIRNLSCTCLGGIYLEESSSAFHTHHQLTVQILPAAKMRLVDPDRQAITVRSNDPDQTMRRGKTIRDAVLEAYATGLFSMSEIVFDKEHRHALLSYSFRCGSLCGNGATLVSEKIQGKWMNTERNCGGWIS